MASFPISHDRSLPTPYRDILIEKTVREKLQERDEELIQGLQESIDTNEVSDAMKAKAKMICDERKFEEK